MHVLTLIKTLVLLYHPAFRGMPTINKSLLSTWITKKIVYSAKSNQSQKVYISLVRSQFFYCSVIWKPHLIKHIQQLERVQGTCH